VVYITNKCKIVNDPVYGFISIPGDFIYDIIEHPWFQRLRNIHQLGLAYYVYPGAVHSRFQHSLGSLHLLSLAIETLRSKYIDISPEEEEAASLAILLHDLGHGAFSHALEGSIIRGVTHEEITLMLMRLLNKEFPGRLDLAIDIFTDSYHRKFFHGLISGQIDMDRMDYLRRDSFFTGVIEGSVGSDRIIRMLNVVDDSLVIEEKGIYSIEKLLIARRLMYWQVYMHKTVLSAESIMEKMVNRARELSLQGTDIFFTPALGFLVKNNISPADVNGKGGFSPEEIAKNFVMVDDTDILMSAKYWINAPDKTLSVLASRLLKRDLLAVEMQNSPFDAQKVAEKKELAEKRLGIDSQYLDYFVFTDEVYNRIYSPEIPDIKILSKNGTVESVSSVSDMFDHDSLSRKQTKYFMCYPKECR